LKPIDNGDTLATIKPPYIKQLRLMCKHIAVHDMLTSVLI